MALTVARLRATPGIDVERVSHWVRTPPLPGGHARNWFLNGVVTLETAWAPHDLLDLCIDLEESAGRRRGLFWADRPLDLDILLIDQQVINTPRLKVPHPGIADRKFVLEPLLEVWPTAVDPVSGGAYSDMPPAPGPQPTWAGLLGQQRHFSGAERILIPRHGRPSLKWPGSRGVDTPDTSNE